MIYFDTNALIMLPLWARDGHPVIDRIVAGESCGVCSVVWYEFLIGPVSDDEVRLALAFVRDNVISVDAVDAQLAATLFNDAGRRRTLKTDALIAASAIRAGAEFLTINTDDFRPFSEYGLRLMNSFAGD